MIRKIRNRLGRFTLSMKSKLTLSLASIALMLLISSLISILEYSRMDNYVSELISDDIASINVAQRLASVVDSYNLGILTVIGDESVSALPDFDQEGFLAHCDSLKATLTEKRLLPLADSVLYSYSAYMLASLELEEVIKSDFIDTRTWYFERLQPFFNRLRADIDSLSSGIYEDLQQHSETFERGFYRSIIPGAVAAGVGIVLVAMLLFFMLIFYVDPLYKMLDNLDSYRNFNKIYNYTFDGDDQLTELNSGITDLTSENRQLKKRISSLKQQQ